MKDKEPIQLRRKKLKNGAESLYLDIYIDGVRSYEFLRLYLSPGTDALTKANNKASLEAANVIRAKRLVEIKSNKAGIITETKRNILLSDYVATLIQRYCDRSDAYRYNARLVCRLYDSYRHNARISAIDKSALLGFIDYLRKIDTKHFRKKVRSSQSARLSNSTINSYLNYLAAILRQAVRDGIIPISPFSLLSPSDRPKNVEKIREYLTVEELRILKSIPFKYPIGKDMFFFGCFTGLRFSDIERLTWRDISSGSLTMVMRKTKKVVTVPLSANAIAALPSRGYAKETDLIFMGHPLLSVIDRELRKWVRSAGIDKNISFHCSRHSFATNLLACGVDLYTVSRLLGHTSVKTTQVYARVIDRMKEEAVNAIPMI